MSSVRSEVMVMPGESLVSDADLVRMIGAGVNSALEELYERHKGVCWGVAKRVTCDERLAEDVVQEVFLAVWRNPQRFDANQKCRTWLVAMTHHKAVDCVRREESQKKRARQVVAEVEFDEVAESVWARVDAERVRAALEVLPVEQRLVIEKAYFQGMSQREISDATGVPLGTVKTRTLLAMKKMRNAMSMGEVRDA